MLEIKTLENNGKHWKNWKTPENTRKHQKTPENTGKHRKTPENFGKTSGNTGKHLKTPENIGKHLKTPENPPKKQYFLRPIATPLDIARLSNLFVFH